MNLFLRSYCVAEKIKCSSAYVMTDHVLSYLTTLFQLWSSYSKDGRYVRDFVWLLLWDTVKCSPRTQTEIRTEFRPCTVIQLYLCINLCHTSGIEIRTSNSKGVLTPEKGGGVWTEVCSVSVLYDGERALHRYDFACSDVGRGLCGPQRLTA